jgi:hypothetical protein
VTVQRAVTDVQGLASTSLVLGSKVGTYAGSFTIHGLNLSPAVFQATATAGIPTFITPLSGSGQIGSVSSTLPVPLTVLVTDMGANPVSGVSVAFTIAATPEGATGQSLTQSQARTDQNGQASTTLRLGNRAGQYVVRASSFGLNGSPVAFLATATSLTHVRSLQTIPSTFEFHPNYPNPFNTSTTIRFGLPEESSVHIEVFNILGSPIGTVVEDRFAAGTYAVRWSSDEVPSGVYLVRMQAYSVSAKEFVSVRRMTVLK